MGSSAEVQAPIESLCAQRRISRVSPEKNVSGRLVSTRTCKALVCFGVHQELSLLLSFEHVVGTSIVGLNLEKYTITESAIRDRKSNYCLVGISPSPSRIIRPSGALARSVPSRFGDGWRPACSKGTRNAVEIAYVDQGNTGENTAQAAEKHGIRLSVVKHPMAKLGFLLLPK